LISCGDSTVGGSTIQTLVDNASGSGLTKSDIDGKQDILTAGNNIRIVTTTDTTTNITTNTISATNEVTQDDLTFALSLKQQKINASVQLTTNTISSSNITGRIGTTISAPTISATETLLVEGTDINTLIDNKFASSSSETYVFVATVSIDKEIRADQDTVLPYDKVNVDIGGGYDNSTYKYTIKKAGVYMFSASATTASGSYDFRANIVHFNGINETKVKRFTNNRKDVFIIINCSVDDNIYCAMNNTSSSNRLELNEFAHFTGHPIVLT